MKSFKKMISGFVCTCMVAGSLALPVYAAEDSVVYQVQDFSTGEILTTTQKDIDTGHWNTAALGENSPIVFEEFPMRVSSEVNFYADLSIKFLYLKMLEAGDSATFTVVNQQTGDIYAEYNLSETPEVVLENIPIGENYLVTLSESFGGEEKVYTRILITENKRADMPLNVSLDEVGETEGIQASALAITKLDRADEETILDEEGNVTDILCERDTIIIDAKELPSHYETLPENSLYKVEATNGNNPFPKNFTGYISTYADGKQQGIFIPGYSLVKEENMAMLKAKSGVEERSSYENPKFSKAEILNNAGEYNYMNDVAINISSGDDRDFVVTHFVCREKTEYKIEVISELNTYVEVWSDSSGSVQYDYFFKGDSGATQRYTTLPVVNLYIAVQFPKDGSGTGLFRIQATEYADQSNSYYDLTQNNERQDFNHQRVESIDYVGDVDVFYLKETPLSGKHVIEVEAKDTNSSADISFDVLREGKTLTGESIVYTDLKDKTVASGKTRTAHYTINSDQKYYVQVKSSNYINNTSVSDDYRMQVKTPDSGDILEPNDTIQTATEWDQREPGEITLHKGDVDYFTFSTDEKLYRFDASLTKVNKIAYNMKLIQLVNGSEKVLAQLEESQSLTQSMPSLDLEPNTRYYVRVDAKGLGSDAYMVDGDYKPALDKEQYRIDAVLDKDVALQGETLEECLDQLTANMTVTAEVYRDTKTLESAQVKKNTKLYYTADGAETELTDEAIQGLTAGEYPITAKVYGSTVYGGTIALTIAGSVEPPPVTGDAVELDTVQVESVLLPFWDWAACAKMMANSRLTREGQPVNTEVVKQAIVSVWGKTEINKRRSIEDTAHMANYFYCGELESDNFYNSDVLLEGAENVFADAVRNGEAIIAYLAGTDIETSRYVLICGVDTTAHRYKIIDPTIGKAEWIPVEELHSGYRGDSNLKFTGQIIELL